MDVKTSPVTMDLPETVTLQVPKQIVLDRNAMIGLAAAAGLIFIGTKIVRRRRLKKIAVDIREAVANGEGFSYGLGVNPEDGSSSVKL